MNTDQALGDIKELGLIFSKVDNEWWLYKEYFIN